MTSSRSRNAAGISGTSFRRRDEQHLGQIERQLHERVAEARVLFRIEHLEQHRRRRRADLVELVEHEHRVPAAHPPQLAQDPARLRILPGPVVAPQVGLVPQSPAGQLHEPTTQRLGRALRQRRLPHPGRAGQAQHRAAARVPTPHGQVRVVCGRGRNPTLRLSTCSAGVEVAALRFRWRGLSRPARATGPAARRTCRASRA